MSMRSSPDSSFPACDSDLERQLDDLEDIEEFDFDDECDSLDDLGMRDELERLGGFSESTSFEDPPAD